MLSNISLCTICHNETIDKKTNNKCKCTVSLCNKCQIAYVDVHKNKCLYGCRHDINDNFVNNPMPQFNIGQSDDKIFGFDSLIVDKLLNFIMEIIASDKQKTFFRFITFIILSFVVSICVILPLLIITSLIYKNSTSQMIFNVVTVPVISVISVISLFCILSLL